MAVFLFSQKMTHNQSALNTVFLLNKEAFASLIQTRLVLKGKTYDAREHKGEVNWKLPFDDPITSRGHQGLILKVVDNLFGNNHPIFPTVDVPLFWEQILDISDSNCPKYSKIQFKTLQTYKRSRLYKCTINRR